MALAVVVIIGCAGGGGAHTFGTTASGSTTAGTTGGTTSSTGTTGTGPTGTPSITIAWPDRTRSISAPNSALSVGIIFHRTDKTGFDVGIKGNRSNGLAAHSDTFTSATALETQGTYLMSATFYANPSEAGAIVGTASATITLNTAGALLTPNGAPLGDLNFTGVIKSATVAAHTANVGDKFTLTASSFDSNNNLVVVTPGSYSFSVATGSSFLSTDPAGDANALAPGTSTVIAKIDGITSSPGTITINGIAPPATWSKFRGDSLNNGRVGGSGATGNVLWSVPVGAGWSSSSIAADGTIYIGSAVSGMDAVSPSGAIKWHFSTGAQIYSGPAIAPDGTLYFGSYDTYIYAVNPNGTQKWAYKTGAPVEGSAAIAGDGTVYEASYDGYLYALNSDGTLKWKFLLNGSTFASPAIGIDGTIYIGANLTASVYAINPNGTQKWVFYTGGTTAFQTPAIAADGTIYVSADDGNLYALTPSGTQKWATPVGNFMSGFVVSSPGIAVDGTIYVGSFDNHLYAVNPDGTVKWSFAANGWVQASPAIGSDGTIYVESYDGNVYAVSPSGSKVWSLPHGGMANSASIGTDGTVYVGSTDGNLYAIR